MHAAPQTVESVVIRFAGDSGDGMQLTGTQFTETSALAGNDLATFPDFPAEIRAPAGSLAGVSGFQVHISSNEVFTPGDEPDVLIHRQVDRSSPSVGSPTGKCSTTSSFDSSGRRSRCETAKCGCTKRTSSSAK